MVTSAMLRTCAVRLPAIWLTRLGEVLPDARHALHLGLAAELALGADLARHARHLGGERRELLDHRVDELGRAQELALERAAVDLQLHGLRQVALGHRADRRAPPRSSAAPGRRSGVLTELSISPQALGGRPNFTRWRVPPCSPTVLPMRSSCWAMLWLAPTMSLNTTAIRPVGPARRSAGAPRSHRRASPRARSPVHAGRHGRRRSGKRGCDGKAGRAAGSRRYRSRRSWRAHPASCSISATARVDAPKS